MPVLYYFKNAGSKKILPDPFRIFDIPDDVVYDNISFFEKSILFSNEELDTAYTSLDVKENYNRSGTGGRSVAIGSQGDGRAPPSRALSQLHDSELVLSGTALRAQPVIRQAEECHTGRDPASRISCFRVVDIPAHETLEAVEFQFHNDI